MDRKIRKISGVILVGLLLASSCLLSVRGTDMTMDEEQEMPEQVPEELPEEENIPFAITCPKEDGMNGYYTRYPVIQILHKDSNHITKYKLSTQDKIQTEGALHRPDEMMYIDQTLLREGSNQLEVWMENKKGELLEEASYIKKLTIDTQCPTVQALAPQGFQRWYSSGVGVSVTANEDVNGSGVKNIECFADGEGLGEIKGNSGIFTIRKISMSGKPIRIKIVAYDHAGNISSVEKELYIDQLPPQTLIGGMEHFMITSQSKEVSYTIQEENVLQEFGAVTKWKNENGEESELPNEEWEIVEGGRKMVQCIKEDGVYQMNMHATDAAGNKSVATSQLIIDKTNPMISHVEELDNTYCKEFVWNYPIEEVIKDITSYTYEVLLDEQLYEKGKKINQEGTHVLKLKAVDAAGNKAVCTATFFIDRTKPQIQFLDIEEGALYEEEKQFRIQAKEIQDDIVSVKINGSERKNQKGNVYQTKGEGEYLIEVVAQDKAGNVNERKFFFEVVPKKNMAHKAVHNIKTTLGLNENKTDTQEKVKKGTPLSVYAFAFMLIAMILFFSGYLVYLKKKTGK